MQGYYSRPVLFNQHIYFISDDDVWKVSLAGGEAQRVSTSKGRVACVQISPDGKYLAYQCDQKGGEDIYLVSTEGGVARKITFWGDCSLRPWIDHQTISFVSGKNTPFRAEKNMFFLNLNGKLTKADWGPCSEVCYNLNQRMGDMVLGKNIQDAARWKRYQGGTSGQFWYREKGKTRFIQILASKFNIAHPVLIGTKLYYISDENSRGEVLCYDLKNKKKNKIYNHSLFYARHLSGDKEHLVFTCGGDIFIHSFKDKKTKKVLIQFPSHKTQVQTRYESARYFLDDYNQSNDQELISIVSRGKLFIGHPWKDGIYSIDVDSEHRYFEPHFLKDQRLVVARATENKEEEICLINKNRKIEVLKNSHHLGKIWRIRPHPKKNIIALVNNRKELYICNLNTKNKRFTKIDYSSKENIYEITWSPQGRYLAYSKSLDERRSGIFIYDTKNKKKIQITQPVLGDYWPRFSENGKYLYFMSVREFHPVYSQVHFDLSFPFAGSIYGVSLQQKTQLPWEEKSDDKKRKTETDIDTALIEQRVFTLDLEVGGFLGFEVAGGKVYFYKDDRKIQTASNWSILSDIGELKTFDLKSQKIDSLGIRVNSMKLSLDGKHLMVNEESDLRIFAVDKKFAEGSEYNETTGLIKLSRFKLFINPLKEWKQIYREAWHLQKEHFWDQNMGGIDWNKVYKRYLPLMDRISSRHEFSDVLWEMQGELGTSHCYEFGGDYDKRGVFYFQGDLGCELKWNSSSKSYTIQDVFHGSTWEKNASSPLHSLGVMLKKGDEILSVDGETFTNPSDIYQILENKGNTQVNLEIRRQRRKQKESVSVKPLVNSKKLIYRSWVEKNKKYVHQKTAGKIGYIHIPDMSMQGFAEFYRHFIVESQRDGLIIDVRFNGGGHVSQLLLRMLKERVIGFDQTRYQGIDTYPSYAVNGPLLCLTNEYAGSDGDIFSHSFKLMGLGKLVGKRTWGGVIGINGQYTLKDGTMTTQPEYSFWFKDVGWEVENYGTDPDIEVDITPNDWKKKSDPQLDKSISEILKDVKSYKKCLLNSKNLPKHKIK